MKTILTSPIEEKCAWFGNDIINNNDWIIRLDDYLLSVLDAAHQHITNLGKKLLTLIKMIYILKMKSF